MKFTKAYSNVQHARRKLKPVTLHYCNWTSEIGIQMVLHTGDDKYAIVEIKDRELDRLIAVREYQRAKPVEAIADGEPLQPMD